MLNFGLSDDQRALIDVAKRFTKERIIPIAAECDRESRFPKDVFVAAHELGLVNSSVPTEYGGPGMGELAFVRGRCGLYRRCGRGRQACSAKVPPCD